MRRFTSDTYEDEAYIDWWETMRGLNDIEIHSMPDPSHQYKEPQRPAPSTEIVQKRAQYLINQRKLHTINRLLAHVYGQERRMSDVLVSYGFRACDVIALSQDLDLLDETLVRFETAFITILRMRFPGSDTRAFAAKWIHGFSSLEAANKYNQKLERAKSFETLFLDHLVTDDGRLDLEQAIVTAVEERLENW